MIQSQRFKLIPAVHLFLIKDNAILLLRRYNTGWEDGKYSLPAGHMDGNEKATHAIMREAKEEIGINLTSSDLLIAHIMHRMSGKEERIDFFFAASTWKGEIKNREKEKCDQLDWFDIDRLPENTIPYIKSALENYQRGIVFSEFGWE